MFVHQGPKRLVMSSSHRASFKAIRPSPSPAPYAQKKPRIKTSTSKEAQNRERSLSAFDAAWKSAVAVTLSKDGLFRAVAHDVVRKTRSSPLIDRFPKVLRAYASAAMGYDDRFVVETYILIRMKQLFSLRLGEQFEQVRKKSMRRLLNPKAAKKVARNECRDADLAVSETLALQAIAGVETHLVELAQKGRRLKHDLPRGYVGVQVRLTGIGRTVGMVVILDGNKEDVAIKAFKTLKEFDRIRRSHFRPKRRPRLVSNRPPKLYH